MARLAPTIQFVFLWCLVAAGCSPAAAVSPTVDNTAKTAAGNQYVANPRLVDFNGTERWPTSDNASKALALVFILPDCPICNSYLPELNRLYEAFADRGVTLALVHVDPEITIERAKAHATEYNIRLPIALDPRHAWVKRAAATIAPEAAVFSPGGELLYRGRIDDQYAGLGKRRTNVTSHDLRDALEAILAGELVPVARTDAVGCPIPQLPNGE